jgi:hypothetical protein
MGRLALALLLVLLIAGIASANRRSAMTAAAPAFHRHRADAQHKPRGEDDRAQRVSRPLELAVPPARGQRFIFPDAPAAVPGERVCQRPMSPGAW